MLSTLLNELAQLHWLDYLALIAGILYVIFAAKEKMICWFFGAVSSLSIAYAVFFFYQLYSDAILQVFYFIMALVGIWNWKRGNGKGEDLAVSKMAFRDHLTLIVSSLLLAIPLAWYFSQKTEAALPVIDAVTTTFSIMTTFLVIGKKLENWLYWIIIDIAYVFIYSYKGAYLFALLMIVYTVIAVLGYFEWRKSYKREIYLEQI